MNLQELITQIKEAEGLTWRGLQERSQERGVAPPTGLFYMGTQPLNEFPKTRTIHGIAAALNVPASLVATAALESLGLNQTIAHYEAPSTTEPENGTAEMVAVPVRQAGEHVVVIVPAHTSAQQVQSIVERALCQVSDTDTDTSATIQASPPEHEH